MLQVEMSGSSVKCLRVALPYQKTTIACRRGNA